MPDRHRLEVRCPGGDPSQATIHLDGKQITWASRVELTLDASTREAEVRLTAPAALLDLDLDVTVDISGSIAMSDEDIATMTARVEKQIHRNT